MDQQSSRDSSLKSCLLFDPPRRPSKYSTTIHLTHLCVHLTLAMPRRRLKHSMEKIFQLTKSMATASTFSCQTAKELRTLPSPTIRRPIPSPSFTTTSIRSSFLRQDLL